MSARRAAAAIAILIAMALLGCTSDLDTGQPQTGQPQTGQPQTWIGLSYPESWTPSQAMSLELAGGAWAVPAEELGFDGVVIVYRDGPVEVRLYGVEDCTVYAAFRANHGSSHTIRFDARGTVKVEDITGSAIPFGPGMNEREPTGCGD